MKHSHSAHSPLHITAYFDFMCPWSYLGRARLLHALKRCNIHPTIEWVPFELYTHNENHRVAKEKILGHTHLNETYSQLHALGARENISIHHPKYEASSKRALTGFLYAQREGKEEKYLDEVFAHTFEHTMDISSFAVLRRIALKLNFNIEQFLIFIQDEKNHARVEEYTRTAKLNGVRGVPTYLINHLPVTGALPVDDLVHIIHTAQKNTLPAFILPESHSKPARTRVKQLKLKKTSPHSRKKNHSPKKVSSPKKNSSASKKSRKRR